MRLPSLATLAALLVQVIGLLLLGAAVFSVLERIRPAVRGQRWWDVSRRVDLCYWFTGPFLSVTVVDLSVIGAVLASARIAGAPHDGAHLEAWIGRQPRALQALEMLVLTDFFGYWAHRLLHGRSLWKFHAIHHAPERLDWLSSTRLHPIDEIVARVIQTVPLVLLGFRGDLLAWMAPFFTAHAIFVHANLSWSFGPLRYVITSPTFHRWHHAAEEAGLDKNFAGLFPIFDLLFGTFYMPDGARPTRFGVTGERVPEGYFAQLLYPFRKP